MSLCHTVLPFLQLAQQLTNRRRVINFTQKYNTQNHGKNNRN